MLRRFKKHLNKIIVIIIEIHNVKFEYHTLWFLNIHILYNRPEAFSDADNLVEQIEPRYLVSRIGLQQWKGKAENIGKKQGEEIAVLCEKDKNQVFGWSLI